MHFSSNIWHLNDFRNLWRKKKSREEGNVMDPTRSGCSGTLAYLALLYSICWPSGMHISVMLYFRPSLSMPQHKPIITVQFQSAEWNSQQPDLYWLPLTDLVQLLLPSHSRPSDSEHLWPTSWSEATSGTFSLDRNSQTGTIAVF